MARIGQGATEYLILLALVVIIALVLVSLISFFPGTVSDSQLAQSQAYWSGTARPFQVMEASSSADEMCGVSGTSGYTIVLQNSLADTLTVTGLLVDGSTGFCESGGTANSPVVMGPGERKIFSVMVLPYVSPCTAGQIVQTDLNITYSTAFVSNNRQAGEKKLMLRCSTTTPYAIGGNITEAGGYRTHIFTGSGSFTASKALTVEVLVVGGGGGGGDGHRGGGGGGGGLVYNPSYSVSQGVIAVAVGSGGASSAFRARGYNGGNSAFGSLIAIGGGGGGGVSAVDGSSGGSGGGAGGVSTGTGGAGGSGTGGQGNSGYAWVSWASGGGGGAGASAVGGAGGNGLQYSISGTSTYYAGGGGGQYSGGGYAGGLGGGGKGGATGNGGSAPTAGTANTGGGGGGNIYGTGAAGGSGIVIVRYKT